MTPGVTRIVITGKGGVGKTTLAATVARLLARAGASVLAVDGDAQCNLARTLGVPPGEAAAIVPLSGNLDYADATVGSAGGLIRLNPDVTDVVDRFGVDAPDGVRLLVMGGLATAGSGCLCPETSLLAATVARVGADAADVVVLDTQAGVEHFGRALARGFDVVLVVSDPTSNAGDVALQTARLARQLGVPRVDLVVNRNTRDALPRWLLDSRDPFDGVHMLPHDELVFATEPTVDALLDGASEFTSAVAAMASTLRRAAGEVAS